MVVQEFVMAVPVLQVGHKVMLVQELVLVRPALKGGCVLGRRVGVLGAGGCCGCACPHKEVVVLVHGFFCVIMCTRVLRWRGRVLWLCLHPRMRLINSFKSCSPWRADNH